jgi:hypothetical protein
MKCSGKRAAGRRRGCNVSRLPVLASIGPLIVGAVVVAALVLIAILLRNP